MSDGRQYKTEDISLDFKEMLKMYYENKQKLQVVLGQDFMFYGFVKEVFDDSLELEQEGMTKPVCLIPLNKIIYVREI